MADINAQARLEVTVTFRISEEEARALDGLVGYGDDAFIEHFKKNLGTHYIRDHEEGLRSFFKSIRGAMPGILHRTDAARKAFIKA